MEYGKAVHERMFVKEPDQQLINAILGLVGEAGEVADFFKKTWFHPNKPKEQLRGELGDILWYLAALNYMLHGDSLLDVAKDNIRKLQTRYPELYNNVNVDDLTL